MQNLDFSSRFKKKSPMRDMPEAVAAPVSEGVTRTNRLLIGCLAISLLAFSGGVFAGLRLGSYRQIESRIIDNANKKESFDQQKSSHANSSIAKERSNNLKSAALSISSIDSGSSSSNDINGNSGSKMSNVGTNQSYVIRIGAFKATNAAKLLIKVNNIPGIGRIRPQKCKMVEERVPNRAPGFRMESPHDPKIHRIFLGCFNDIQSANRAYQLLIESKLFQGERPRLIELD